jgi:hypothetical protein
MHLMGVAVLLLPAAALGAVFMSSANRPTLECARRSMDRMGVLVVLLATAPQSAPAFQR